MVLALLSALEKLKTVFFHNLCKIRLIVTRRLAQVHSVHSCTYMHLTSNPLQGQVGERPHQHVEPLLVPLCGPLGWSIHPTARIWLG